MNVKETLEKKYSADLIATYEELKKISPKEQLTEYFGDYSLHAFKDGVTTEDIAPVYEKALVAMEMTEKEFSESKDRFLYRGEIISRMRECLLEKELEQVQSDDASPVLSM